MLGPKPGSDTEIRLKKPYPDLHPWDSAFLLYHGPAVNVGPSNPRMDQGDNLPARPLFPQIKRHRLIDHQVPLHPPHDPTHSAASYWKLERQCQQLHQRSQTQCASERATCELRPLVSVTHSRSCRKAHRRRRACARTQCRAEPGSLGGRGAGFAAEPGGVRAVRAAGAGATAAAAAGGAIAAAVAATGRGAAVGDRGRGCRRRSGWVRPGAGRAGPLPLGRLPGLCVGPGGREQRRRPRPGRGDAPVRPGARGGARRQAS